MVPDDTKTEDTPKFDPADYPTIGHLRALLFSSKESIDIAADVISPVTGDIQTISIDALLTACRCFPDSTDVTDAVTTYMTARAELAAEIRSALAGSRPRTPDEVN